jgi:2-hydroxycyclohexanecarboxyl-CoA dehydrogenase
VNARVAFVCGASPGIGHAVAETLASRGARVALAVPDGDGLRTGPAPGVDGAQLLSIDLRRPASVQAAVAAARSACGPIEILVNCAEDPIERPFLETDDTQWRALVEVALMGVFRVSQVVLPEMIAQGFGRVVNVASDTGRIGGAGQAIYSGCGGGVIAFTKTIARELARHSITANTVCYGPMQMPSASTVDAGDAESRLRAIPLRRLGQPAELAAAVAFFASEEAGFVTGQTLSVNGGTSMV